MNKTFYITNQKQRSVSAILVIVMLMSLFPWFLYFFVEQTTLVFVNVILIGAAYFLSPNSFRFTKVGFGVFAFMFVAALLGTYGNANAYIGTVLRSLPFFFFMYAKSEVRIETLNLFNKVYVWILGISLVFWILFLIGAPLPHFRLNPTGTQSYEFDCFYVFVNDLHGDTFFPRFCSIFLEPGYISCFIVLMLFVEKFDFRKRSNLVYLVALILTFSLAGWIFFFIALIPFMTQRGRMKWWYIIILLVVLGTVVYYNNSDSANVINMMIGNRLTFENGEMVGYNRANMELEYYWNNGFWNSGNELWGIRDAFTKQFDFGGSVDARAYIIHFGLIAMLAYVLFLVKSLLSYRSWFGFWIFVIVTLFAYRGYSIMFCNALLFVYIAALEKCNYDSIEKGNRLKELYKKQIQ